MCQEMRCEDVAATTSSSVVYFIRSALFSRFVLLNETCMCHTRDRYNRHVVFVIRNQRMIEPCAVNQFIVL